MRPDAFTEHRRRCQAALKRIPDKSLPAKKEKRRSLCPYKMWARQAQFGEFYQS
jgi:hypothetical protein